MGKRNYLFICLLITVLFLSINSFASKYHPQIGEEIRYKMYAMGIYIGDSVMRVEKKVLIDGKNYFHIRMETESTNSIAAQFYSLHDIHSAYLDEKTLLPVKSVKNIHEGKYRSLVTLKFLRDKKEYFFYQDGKPGQKFTFEHPALDLLSLVFFIRGLNVNVKNDVYLNLILHDRPDPFIGRIISEESRRRYTLITFKEMKHKFLTITFTKDDRRIPIKMSIKGFRVYKYQIDITAILSSYKLKKIK